MIINIVAEKKRNFFSCFLYLRKTTMGPDGWRYFTNFPDKQYPSYLLPFKAILSLVRWGIGSA